jgi:hypothetical protein
MKGQPAQLELQLQLLELLQLLAEVLKQHLTLHFQEQLMATV